MVTIRPNRQSAGVQTYSLPNIHGDIFATTDADGKLTGIYQTGPYGEKLPNAPTSQVLGQTTDQTNTLNGASFAYVGQHEKLSESTLTIQPIQMGARVYIPGIGRFLSVDPVQGGTPNPYVYPNDPVNDFDLTGMAKNKGRQPRSTNARRSLSQNEQRALQAKNNGQKYNAKDYKSAVKKGYAENKYNLRQQASKRLENMRKGGTKFIKNVPKVIPLIIPTEPFKNIVTQFQSKRTLA